MSKSGTQALSQLRANPMGFLSTTTVLVSSAGSIAGPAPFIIAWSELDNRFTVGWADKVLSPGGSARFDAWHIPVDKANQVDFGALQAVPVSRVGGPDIMVTTQLTGCCFACTPMQDLVLMQHVQPVGCTAAELATNMSGASTQGGAVGTAFGSSGDASGYDYRKCRVNIVGVRKNRTWSVFAQDLIPTSRTPQQVRKIWEG